MTINELLAPDQPITWLPWAVQYFFLIGLAYGALWLGAADLWRKAPDRRLQTLAAVGLHSIQGYVFSKPMPAADVPAWHQTAMQSQRAALQTALLAPRSASAAHAGRSPALAPVPWASRT